MVGKSIPKKEVETTASKTTKDSVDECVDGWKYNKHTKKCYKLFHEPRMWSSAALSCRWNENNASLASVLDRKTEEFLIELAKGFSDSVWLGGSADGDAGKWQLKYRNWPEDELNNGSDNEHYLKFWWDRPIRNDDGYAKHGYICQYQ